MLTLKVVENKVVLTAKDFYVWDWNEAKQRLMLWCGVKAFKDACQRDLGLYDLSDVNIGTYAIPETSNYLNLDDEDAVAEFVRGYMQKKAAEAASAVYSGKGVLDKPRRSNADTVLVAASRRVWQR